MPNTNSAASVEGASFIFGILLGRKEKKLFNILLKIFPFNPALLDLYIKLLAPPHLAANKSSAAKDC